ncbi:MAG: ribonuclease E/G, partial [bacterium]|nr:ribonuclease E/G [bacterium]
MSVIETVVNTVRNWLRRNKLKREIIVNVEKLETRVAVLENGRLEEYMVEHSEDERLVGCVFKGRIQNLQDDLQAAFVDIGLKKNAFLHYWDMQPDVDAFLDEIDDGDDDDGQKNGGKNGKNGGRRRGKAPRLTTEEIHEKFKPGSEIIVQVTKGPISTKGPRVTTNLSIPGRYLVMMPGTKTRGVSRKIGDAEERKRLKKILDKLLLPEEVGLIVRTAGVGAKGTSFVRDMRNLLESWHELQGN